MEKLMKKIVYQITLLVLIGGTAYLNAEVGMPGSNPLSGKPLVGGDPRTWTPQNNQNNSGFYNLTAPQQIFYTLSQALNKALDLNSIAKKLQPADQQKIQDLQGIVFNLVSPILDLKNSILLLQKADDFKKLKQQFQELNKAADIIEQAIQPLIPTTRAGAVDVRPTERKTYKEEQEEQEQREKAKQNFDQAAKLILP